VAEDVHQQRIGAAAGVELAEASIVFDLREPFRNRQHFSESSKPNPAAENGSVARRIKVAVACSIGRRREDETAEIALAAPEGDSILLREVLGARSNLTAKLSRVDRHE
jgi:hypothetical protein